MGRHAQLSSTDGCVLLGWGLLFVAMACSVGFITLADFSTIASNLPDDASYYFQIAKNIAEGHGSTFDRINPTNGYQPLWLLVLSGVFCVIKGTPETLTRVALVLQAGMLFLGGWIFFRIQKTLFPPIIALLSMVVYVFAVFFRGTNGMESAILIFTLIVLYDCGYRWKIIETPDRRKEFVFGLVLGLVMLARMDMLFLGVCVTAASLMPGCVARKHIAASVARTIAIVGGASLVVAPYLIYNYLAFGHIAPISAALKSSFPHLVGFSELYPNAKSGVGHSIQKTFVYACFLFAVFYCVYFAGKWRLLRRNEDGRLFYYGATAVFSGAIVFHYLHACLFIKFGNFGWHYTPYGLFFALAVCGPAFRLLSRVPKMQLVVAPLLGALILAGGIVTYRQQYTKKNDWLLAAYRAGIWARDHTDKNDIFALMDTGHFCFFSERRVINLDGLVNSWEYQEALREQKGVEYLKSKGVGYFVSHRVRDIGVLDNHYDWLSFRMGSWLYNVSPNIMWLNKTWEFHRCERFEAPTPPGWNQFIIWKLDWNLEMKWRDEKSKSQDGRTRRSRPPRGETAPVA